MEEAIKIKSAKQNTLNKKKIIKRKKKKDFISVPEFDLSVPAAGDDLGGLVRMPDCADAHFVVCFDSVVQFSGLPVPDIQLPICITRHHVTTERK